VHLKRLLVFLDALKQYALEWKESKTVKSEGHDYNSAKRKGSNSDLTEVMTISQFMERLGRKASSINFLEIEKYLKTSKVSHITRRETRLIIYAQVARKVSGYAEKQAEKAGSWMASLPGHETKFSCARFTKYPEKGCYSPVKYRGRIYAFPNRCQ